MLSKNLETSNDKFNKLQSEFTLLEKEYHQIKYDTANWQKQHEIIRNQFEEQNHLLIEQQKQNVIMQQQLLVTQTEIKQIKEDNQLLIQEKWEIAQEKARLEGQLIRVQKSIA